MHLIHRQKAKEVRFSTLRFLRISVQRTRRRKYIEDLSLLVVRVAVLLLIAVGLARPALSSLAALWGRGQAAAIAIVLDNSASMAVTDGGRPRFETARQAAEQVLARLREGDQVALLPTGGPPGPELGRLFRTHETVRQALDQCRPSYERADLAAKLQQARDLLAQAEATSKEIYVFTDNQSLSWEGLKEPAEGEAPRSRTALPSRPSSWSTWIGSRRPTWPSRRVAGQPGPGRRGVVPGRGRGPQHLDGAPAEAPGAARSTAPGRRSARPSALPPGGIAQARVPVHPRPGGRPSGRGPARRGRWLGPG